MKAKKERFGWRPRAATVAARASCGSSGASAASAASAASSCASADAAPRAALRSLAASPVWRRVRLVDDDREPALPEVRDLVEDERELLERRDDDPALLARERLRELRAVLVDPRDDAGRVLELVDRLLELAVEDHPVGDDDDLVEDRLVVGSVERHEPMGEPGDRVALARAGRVLDEVGVARALGAGGRPRAGGRRPTGGSAGR